METNSMFNQYLEGHAPEAYNFFGAHLGEKDGTKGCFFRVYAPLAQEVDLIGDFDNWDPLKGKMEKTDYRGLFEIFVPGASEGQKYKFHILGCDGFWKDKEDPFAFRDESYRVNCSTIVDLSRISVDDEEWVRNRDRNFDKPVSIYEFHFGTWKKKDDGSLYNYNEMADLLIPYLKEMGYTHIESLPITSYPNDASWGYQALGFFAIDSRYGTPYQFAQFVEKMHKAGIGVILDFVPVHFAIDNFGLEKFDGSCVYEYNNEHEFTQWGTKGFDLGKDPVRSFLISSLIYFGKLYHVDGFRMDAVSNVIYWEGNCQRGENSGAIEFVKRANGYLHALLPGVMSIAEDSSAYGHVTKGMFEEGLGFDYKWDLGWMNDTLKYYAKDPVYKKYCHNQITFSMAYFYSENFILPLSHDEVVHMKGSILNKMWGSYDNKFANVRNLYAYMYAHPGKKLNFMGNEMAEFDEWKEFQSLSFDVLNYPKHRGVQRLVRDLNRIYRSHSCLFRREYDPSGFSWIMADNSNQSVYIFKREDENECLIFIFNMTPNFYWDYDVGVPYEGSYEEILNTDKDCYGGWNQFNPEPIHTYGNGGLHNQKHKLTLKIPSFGGIYLLYRKPRASEEEHPYLSKEPDKQNVFETSANK